MLLVIAWVTVICYVDVQIQIIIVSNNTTHLSSLTHRDSTGDVLTLSILNVNDAPEFDDIAYYCDMDESDVSFEIVLMDHSLCWLGLYE